MAHCSRCNKLMLSPSDSRYCKYCEIVVQKEAHHKAEVQEKHAEEQRRKEEELKKNNDAQRSVARLMNLYEETLRNAEETRKQKIEKESGRSPPMAVCFLCCIMTLAGRAIAGNF